MSVKVLCPKCRTEITDPADLKKVTCHACTFTFDFDAQATVIQHSDAIPKRIGKYEILQEISRGGMGVVYKAHQRELDRQVAIKVVTPKLAEHPEFVERFFREAKALAKLNHPNIVQVYDADRDGDTVFMVMEFVEGQSLRQILKSRPKGLSVHAPALIAQICKALDYAHAQGVVHRDIKPENILVTRDKGEVKIADFGLAVLFTSDPNTPRLTSANVVLGTYDYMAPEQRQGSANVDHRADLYSLGVVMYEMLTGRLPLGRVDPPSVVSSFLSHFDAAVLQALDADPSRRQSRASQILEALQPPATASPPAAKLPRVFAAILVFCTLVALWVTAARVKSQKMAARYGDRLDPPAPTERARLRVAADRRLSGTNARNLEDFFSKVPKGQTVDVEIDPASGPQRQSEVLDHAERHGVSVRFVTGDTRLAKLHLRRGQKIAVEHFSLLYWSRADNLSVFGEGDRHLVEFLHLKKGQQRGWQELQMTLLEAGQNEITVEVEIRPGASCFGDGWYYAIKPGLRIEFERRRTVTLTSWDPAKPELRLTVEHGDKAEEKTLGDDTQMRALDVFLWLKKHDSQGWGVLLDSSE